MTTPIMNQYDLIKSEHKDCILLFRLGDFYEMFNEDASIAAEVLNITLTKRVQKSGNIPMAGIPFHACDHYISKLVKAGYKIAICEQVENSFNKTTKIIDRQVVRIITAGTITDDILLDSKRNNFLISLSGDLKISCAVFDISTSEFYVEEIEKQHLKNFFEKIEPSEILINQNWLNNFNDYNEYKRIITFVEELNLFKAESIILNFFNLHSKESLAQFSKENLITIAMIINYLMKTQKTEHFRINFPTKANNSDYMEIDKFSRRNLEITKTLQNTVSGSLLWLLDETKTPQGARALFQYINNPICNIDKLNDRYKKINYFIANKEKLKKIRESLKNIPDFERIFSKIALNRSNPYELRNLAIGIKNLVQLCLFLDKHIETNEDITNEIIKAISAEPNLKENYINNGYDAELDEWKNFEQEIDKQISDLEEQYKSDTKISNLRIKLTQSGFLIEINNNQKEKLSYHFHLKQNLKTTSRYSTIQLEKINQKYSESNEFIQNKEKEIFKNLCQKMLEIANDIYLYSKISAEIDLFGNFAHISIENNYTMPVLTKEYDFEILEGRHPILDKIFKEKGSVFIKNDCDLTKQHIMFMTGPNMAGKSTFLRQQALIALLAHIGMFVPAKFAKIGIIDQIFSRISTNDNLIQGNSTFMMEMIEVALTLNQASIKSFLILDEVGRGTSAKEGIAISQAILEHLIEKLNARTIFSTHYLELKEINSNSLQKKMMEIEDDPIHFTYKLIDGVAEKSYAINVAKIAGMPQEVIKRAEQILAQK